MVLQWAALAILIAIVLWIVRQNAPSSLKELLQWTVLVALILIIVVNTVNGLRELEYGVLGKVTQMLRNLRRKAEAWWLIVLLIIIGGLVVWALPNILSLHNLSDIDWEKFGRANRYSELGAALTGGAIVAGIVLFIERLYAARTENRAMQFEVGRQRDVSGVDLRDRDLKNSYWRGKDVSEAYLTNAKLDGSVLANCNFSATTFSGTSFTKVKIRESTRFRGANLGGADFTGADLREADFFGAFLNGHIDPLTDESFGGANLTRADLSGNDLTGAILGLGNEAGGADLNRTDLRGSNLEIVAGILYTRNRDKAIHDDTTKWPGGVLPEGFTPLTS